MGETTQATTTRTTPIVAILPRSLAEAFQRIAEAHDRSVATELRRAVREYVVEHEFDKED